MSTAMQRVSHDKVEWDPEVCRTNEMVSVGDTEISLHIRPGQGGILLKSKSSKCQDMPKFEFSGGGDILVKSKSSKCQDLSELELGRGVFF